MSALATLQSAFQDAVLSGDPAPGLFVGEGRGEGGLPIYLTAYPARLRAALRDNHPVLHRALGDGLFDELADAYIGAHPSGYRSLRGFGDRLADFIAARPERLPHPAMADLARMDWALRDAFDAAPAVALNSETLLAVPPADWPGLRLRGLPSLRVVDLAWSVEPAWHRLNADPDAESEEPQRHAHALLVWRPELECLWRSASAVEADCLRRISGGTEFASWCAGLAEAGHTDVARLAAGFVRRWIDEAILAAG